MSTVHTWNVLFIIFGHLLREFMPSVTLICLMPWVYPRHLSPRRTPRWVGTGKVNDTRRYRGNTFMLHISFSKQVDSLMKLKQILHIHVVVSLFKPMDTCNEVVRSPMLRNTTYEDFVENVPDVIAAQRITIRKPGTEPFQTNTVILTFQSTTMPTAIKVGYEYIPVSAYIPNPFRCYKCHYSLRVPM